MPREGHVSLVGAGPGDPDLLTVRALRCIESAQALLFDALVDPRIVALVPARCVCIGVGKRGDGMQVPQEKTNALMARLAARGLHVVRLKGGDPSMFGRAEEERDYLEARGVPVRTVPGITAASAAAAQFAFPLTHRGLARRVLYLTGRTQDGVPDIGPPETLADPETTLVFYMASHVAGRIRRTLLDVGKAASTPVLIVENAGWDSARAVSGSLATLADDIPAANFSGPVVIVVGPVAAMARDAESGLLQKPTQAGRTISSTAS